MNYAFLLVLLLALPASGDTSLYHADPNHLWNRLHQMLWVRTGPDGKEYGGDRLDLLRERWSTHLLQGPSHEQAVAVLDEFLSTHGDSLIGDPLKRVVLQRDLWQLLEWVRGRHTTERGEPLMDIAELQRAQAHLQELLARAILHVASDTGQVAALPDNYTTTVQAGAYPSSFDPDVPDQPFLPPDLFDPEGSWVCLGRPDGPAALRHMQGQAPGNSMGAVWLAFLRLPGGRPETLEYLEKISGLEIHTQVPSDKTVDFLSSLNLPQFPEGTQVALVRRLMSIGADGRLLLTPLVLQVQLRVYRHIPAGRAGILKSFGYSQPEIRSWQSHFLFRLSRTALFAGQAGGLQWVDVEADDEEFIREVGIFAMSAEQFRQSIEKSRQYFAESHQGNKAALMECAPCHSGSGVYSFNSFGGGLQGVLNDASGVFSAPHLYPTSPAKAGQVAVAWKEKQSEWRMLREVLLEEAAKR